MNLVNLDCQFDLVGLDRLDDPDVLGRLEFLGTLESLARLLSLVRLSLPLLLENLVFLARQLHLVFLVNRLNLESLDVLDRLARQ